MLLGETLAALITAELRGKHRNLVEKGPLGVFQSSLSETTNIL